jgi:hypothetical protein
MPLLAAVRAVDGLHVGRRWRGAPVWMTLSAAVRAVDGLHLGRRWRDAPVWMTLSAADGSPGWRTCAGGVPRANAAALIGFLDFLRRARGTPPSVPIDVVYLVIGTLGGPLSGASNWGASRFPGAR